MTYRKAFAFTLVLGCAALGSFVAAQPPAAAPAKGSVKARLLGNWKLVSYVVFDASGAARPGNYDVGRVVYDAAGEMSAHLMNSKRATETPATDLARSQAYSTYLAYFGPFTVDEAKGTVTHHVYGSSYPHWLGTDQVRHYSFDPNGRRLTLSVKTGVRTTGSLVWERVE